MKLRPFVISVQFERVFTTPKIKQASEIEELKERYGIKEEGTYITSVIISFTEGTPEEILKTIKEWVKKHFEVIEVTRSMYTIHFKVKPVKT